MSNQSAADPWAAYVPDKDAPWDLRRVVHLHRRAGFAATWDELQRDLKDGPAASIDRVLAGTARARGVPENFEQTAEALAAAVSYYNAERLQAWWVYRMVFGPDPLTERLTLLWHNHFATSAAKVKDLAVMRRQNELFRKHARAPFADLLTAVVHDPALLLWLDAEANRKEHPNENLARELMELFTLGVGYYTEKDVKEAARALTGWTVRGGKFAEDAGRHDGGTKTILGRTGAWTGDDLVRLLLDQPAAAERLAWRLGTLFLGEGAVDAAGLRALAACLREHHLDVGWAVATVLRSRAFFAEPNLGARVLGPVEYVVGAARALEMFDPPPGTLLLADWSGRLGQDLFYPPNVGGWPGGRAWISTQTMIGRANFAAALVEGKLFRRQEPFDALGLARRHGRGDDLADTLTFYAELLRGEPPSPAWRERLLGSLGPSSSATPETARRAVALILASPETQLA
jgi:uncharacterized protein (DUF1800 family)